MLSELKLPVNSILHTVSKLRVLSLLHLYCKTKFITAKPLVSEQPLLRKRSPETIYVMLLIKWPPLLISFLPCPESGCLIGTRLDLKNNKFVIMK